MDEQASTELHELRQEVARLKVALAYANQQLDRLKEVPDTAVGWIVGTVIRDNKSQLGLIQSDNIIYGVQTTFPLEKGKRYIIPFWLDGHFNNTCKTHHIILQAGADEVIPASLSKDITITPQNALALNVVTKFVNTFIAKSS